MINSGFTPIPNAILDLMPEVSDECFRTLYALAFKTANGHEVMDLAELSGATGLSYPKVIAGIEEAEGRGFITRNVQGFSLAESLR